MKDPQLIRNVAIIAHVDHGKTTLVDGLLKQSNTFRSNQAEMEQSLIMDSGDQEHERGITITAKQTSVYYGDYKINIIDTPGHADFSGEVERTLNMADGVLLIVDAQEGPMPQTKFVLSKALELGLKPVVVINKIDKPSRRIDEVLDEVSELFLELAVTDDQLQYPVYYAIGRDGKAWTELPDNPAEHTDLTPIFDAIINDIPAPTVAIDKPFQMPIEDVFTISGRGTVVTGRIEQGIVKTGEEIEIIGIRDTQKKVVTGVEMFRKILDEGQAGDNVGVLLRGTDRDEVERGQVLAVPGSITPHTKFAAEVYVLTKEEGGRHTPFFKGYRPQFYFRTTDVTGSVELPDGIEMVMPGDAITFKVELISPIAMDKGLKFAIREGGRTVGSGIITEITD